MTPGDYLAVLRRRWWLALFTALVTPLRVVLLSLSQEPRYAASPDVLLTRKNHASVGAGELGPKRVRFGNDRVWRGGARVR